jgi:hypothetical protein
MATWVYASGGHIPDGAIQHGHEADGKPLYVARAHYSGGLHPGKVRGEFGAANIPYGGAEVKVYEYEVLVGPGVWSGAENGVLPVNAIKCGHEKNGESLFVARGWLNDGLHPGKFRPAFGGANIPWGGREVKVNPYDVLVLGSAPTPPEGEVGKHGGAVGPISDPDGNQKPILDSTVQSFEVPANKGAYLYGSFDAAWEQAAVIYVDGVNGAPTMSQIGNYNRPTFMVVGRKDTKQTVTIAGWHKRSGPDGQNPWNASRGKREGNLILAYDDSGYDGDFNDMRIKVVID